MKDAMTKATAPMIGGIITPPVEAQASTAAAVLGENPVRFIAGMDTAPVVMIFEMTDPLIEPISPLPTVATLAAPPR